MIKPGYGFVQSAFNEQRRPEAISELTYFIEIIALHFTHFAHTQYPQLFVQSPGSDDGDKTSYGSEP
jgi:hypothetical protein